MLQHRRLLEAQEKTETQRRLVDILSHEVGTALTTVTGQAYRLTRLTGPISPVDLRTRAEKLRRAVDRIQTIISRIQIASSLGDGTIPTSHEQIDVRTVVQQIVEQFAEDRSGQIELHLPPAPTIVAGEELMLRQIFENLISNSIKYSTPDSTIEVSVALVAAGVMTTISDHGSGISKDDLQRIRAAYYRGENSKGISGAGLGLHVVDRLIEAHHGRMIIESEIGRGTTIKVELPRAGPLQ
jgi:signal transduction histidine kinase